MVDVDESNFGNKLTSICLIIPELKCQTKELIQNDDLSPENIDEAKTIFYCGVSVDAKLQNWQTNDAWVPSYKTVQASTIDWLCADEYPYGIHIYQDLASACIWNLSRIARIQLNIVLLSLLNWLGPERLQRFEEQRRNRLAALHLMVRDTCASIPYHVGNRQPCMNPLDVKYPSVDNLPMDEQTWVELYYKAAGTTLIPLMTCQLVESLPCEHRWWIDSQINRVRQIMRNTTEKLPENTSNLENSTFLMFSRAVDVR